MNCCSQFQKSCIVSGQGKSFYSCHKKQCDFPFLKDYRKLCSGFNESFWRLGIVHYTTDATLELRGQNGTIMMAVGFLKVRNNPGRCLFYPLLWFCWLCYQAVGRDRGKDDVHRTGMYCIFVFQVRKWISYFC